MSELKKYEVHKSHFHRGPLNSDNYESVYLAADVEQRDDELRLMTAQILALSVEGNEIEAIATRLLERLR